MSALHERLLTEPDIWTREAQSDPTGAVDRLAAAVRAVLERHKPVPCRHSGCRAAVPPVPHIICAGCGSGRNWPEGCPDTMAIADALGVEIGETP